MQFMIEQIAICPPDPDAAEQLLTDIGAAKWVKDTVTAEGFVRGKRGTNEANLAFNYDFRHPDQLEFEILDYRRGPNWMAANPASVSHLGMHCTADELLKWKRFFMARKINVAQEVNTVNHTNPAIAGKRSYNYVIFDTRAILGVDLKFIVRAE